MLTSFGKPSDFLALLLCFLGYFQIWGRTFGVKTRLAPNGRLWVVTKTVSSFVGLTENVFVYDLPKNIDFEFPDIEHFKFIKATDSRFDCFRNHLILSLRFFYLQVRRYQVKTLTLIYNACEMKFSRYDGGGVPDVLYKADHAVAIGLPVPLFLNDRLFWDQERNPSPFSDSIFTYLYSDYDNHSYRESGDNKGGESVKPIHPVVRLLACPFLFGLFVFCIRCRLQMGLDYDGLVCWGGMIFRLLLGAYPFAAMFWVLSV